MLSEVRHLSKKEIVGIKEFMKAIVSSKDILDDDHYLVFKIKLLKHSYMFKDLNLVSELIRFGNNIPFLRELVAKVQSRELEMFIIGKICDSQTENRDKLEFLDELLEGVDHEFLVKVFKIYRSKKSNAYFIKQIFKSHRSRLPYFSLWRFGRKSPA